MCITEEGNDGVTETKAARIIQKRLREYVSRKYDLIERQKEFIWPYYKRWKGKSIFQVLLLYRAERLQALTNFCLQIHLYNQSSLNDLQRTKESINLEDLDPNAKVSEYLPPLKPCMPKLWFGWKSLNLHGDIKNCEPLPHCNVPQLEAQVYSTLIKKKDSHFKQDQRNSKNFEDKVIQTSLSDDNLVLQNKSKEEMTYSIIITEQNENQEKKLKEETNWICSQNRTVENKTTIKNEAEVIKQQLSGDLTSNMNEQIQINLKPPNTTENNRPPLIKPRKNSKTKVIPLRKFQYPLTEMEEKFRNKNYNESDDDPPFNFRALLKKTNFPESLISSHNNLFFEKQHTTFGFPERKKPLQRDGLNNLNKYRQTPETIVMEIAPGILLYGKAADL